MNMQNITVGSKRKPMAQWLWKSYLRAALIPLLVVEITFLGLYWASNQFIYERKVDLIKDISAETMADVASSQADVIAQKLMAVSQLTDVYAKQTGLALDTPDVVDDAERLRHGFSPEGVFYTTKDNGGSAVYYSAITDIGEKEKDKVWRTVRLDPLMKSIKDSNPLIAQIYFNTKDSYNRIYPYFDVLPVYPPKMDIPSYNFYYEADAKHNPTRKVVWTDAYVDPAGSGWMVSAIAPVYVHDKLEAVAGIDVTIQAIVTQVLNLEIPWKGYALLVGREGTILALPPQGEKDWGLTELTNYSYQEAVLSDTFKPDHFNIYKRSDVDDLVKAFSTGSKGVFSLELKEKMVASWSQIPGADWKLVVLAPEREIMAEATSLRALLDKVAWLMLAGLLIFYMMFFAFLWRRANQVGKRLTEPLSEIVENFSKVTENEYTPPVPDYEFTELQQVGENLVKTSNQIAVASKAKTQFLANMSHEIRTPMNGVIGMLEVLSHSDLSGEDRKIVQTIRQSAVALLGIINDVLDFSKIEAGKLELSTSVFQLEDEFDAIAGLLDRSAQERKVELTLFFAPTIPQSVMGDELRLRQILTNLTDNALKFSSGLERPGKVHLRAELEKCEAGQAWVRFSVIDNGIGIDQQTLDRLFNSFEQADGGTTRTYGGTGLGLAISQSLAKLMGGHIEVESQPGEGATFSFCIPLAIENDEEANDYNLSDVEVVLVSEESRYIDDYKRYLSHAGARVHAVQKLDAGWGLISKKDLKEPVCMFVMEEPGMQSSSEIVERLSHKKSDKDIRVVIEISYLSIEKGKRRKPRILSNNVLQIDREVLTRRSLLEAMAQAVGRLSSNHETTKEALSGAKVDVSLQDKESHVEGTILVAEDNETNRDVIERQLALLGFDAELCEDGQIAYEKWQSGEYALLLTDLHMPRLDGYDLTTQIRQAEAEQGKARLPIVALTANALKGEMDKCLEIGMDGYLTKPVELQLMKEEILKHFSAVTSEQDLSEDVTASNGKAQQDVAPVDPTALNAIVGDDPEVHREFLEAFIPQAVQIIEEINEAYGKHNGHRISELGHKLKSSSRTIGANPLADLCQELEKQGKEGNWQAVEASYAQLQSCFDAVVSFIETEVA